MSRHGHILSATLLCVAASIAIACGGSTPQREIQSISISPSTADAQDYPNGQVQFVATGAYNLAPITVTPLTANWAVNNSGLAVPVSITTDGLAQCMAGASGVYSRIW
jgi:hypothetical protein